MGRNLKISVLAVLLAATAVAATAAAAAEMRTWNLNSSATMEAEIVGFPSPETVEVNRSDGKVSTLPTA